MNRPTYFVYPPVYAYFDPLYLTPSIYTYYEPRTGSPKFCGPYGRYKYGPY